jgi:hypothetical protein
MNKERKNATINLTIIAGILMLFEMYVTAANAIWPPEKPFKIENVTSLRPDTSVHVSQEEIALHNNTTRDILIKRLAWENAYTVAREQLRTQMRGFYLVVLAGLGAFVSRTSKKVNDDSSSTTHSSSAQEIVKQFGRFILPTFIIIVFMLEVHQDDLNYRYIGTSDVYSAAVDQLTDSVEDSDKWQRFHYDDVKKEMDRSSSFCNRWSRILMSASRPGADQIVLYYLPLIALIVVTFRKQ